MIFNKKYLFILFSLIFTVFIIFWNIPNLHKYVVVYKISHVKHFSDDNEIIFTAFDLSKLFNNKLRYTLAKSDLGIKYLIKYDDFFTRNVSVEDTLAVVIKTRKKISSEDLERLSYLMANQIQDLALNYSTELLSKKNIVSNGKYYPISIDEFSNINMKRKGPYIIVLLIIIFYSFLFSSFVRNALKK